MQESDFRNRLLESFDVAHTDCDKLIQIAQDAEFLQDQRSERKMVMAEEDESFGKKEEKRQKRVQA